VRRRHEGTVKKIKAIMPAAPSSAFLPADKIDTPLDHNSMRDAGTGLGCGVVRLIAEGTCIVEEVLKISEFFTAESCGQCPACRMETNTLTMMLKKVQAGQGGQAILEQFGKILAFNKGKGFCNLIAMPGPPIESALKLFPRISRPICRWASARPIEFLTLIGTIKEVSRHPDRCPFFILTRCLAHCNRLLFFSRAMLFH
jgi:NADH:ubiquinone oxidoreductase subunit F (NADH-binding)